MSGLVPFPRSRFEPTLLVSGGPLAPVCGNNTPFSADWALGGADGHAIGWMVVVNHKTQELRHEVLITNLRTSNTTQFTTVVQYRKDQAVPSFCMTLVCQRESPCGCFAATSPR